MPRQDVLEFFREPRRFAGGITQDESALWRASLNEVAAPTVPEGTFRAAQLEAWNGIADHRAALLLGPPGTGKTFALAWMALAYLEIRRRRGLPCRVLLTGFTRNSIANLLEAMHKKSAEYGFGPTTFCWVGREPPPGLPQDIAALSDEDATQSLAQPHLVMGSTSWGLYRLIEKSQHPSTEGHTAALFDLVCIDEASQMVVSQGLMCLAGLASNGRVLVAGDNRQLPPVRMIHEHAVDERQIGGSLYDFLQQAQVAEFRLDETFRLNAPLAGFPSQHFYDDQYHSVHPERRLVLRQGWDTGLEPWEREALDPDRPVCILLHEGPAAGTHNPLEVALVVRLTQLFRDRMVPTAGEAGLSSDEFWDKKLAVITPHRAQNAAIKEALRGRGMGDGCIVETVDRIQGRERDAILASYTVADSEFARAEAEFIFSPERFNVTITRARTKLVLIISHRLLQVIPDDEEVFDAAQTLREFVFSSEDRGRVHIRGPDGVEWPVSVRVRRFDEREPLPKLDVPQAPRSTAEPLPEPSPRLMELLEQIREVARENSKFGNAPDFVIERRFTRKPTVEELRALSLLGHVALLGMKTGLAARPLAPPRKPIPAELEAARLRLEEVIDGVRRGSYPPKYTAVRERFDWVGPDGGDRLKPVLEQLAREGVVRWETDRFGSLTLDYVTDDTAAEEAPPPAEELTERDFVLLNRLEEMEARRINFGVFEQWTTPRELMRALEWDAVEVSEGLRRLSDHGWVLLTEAGQVRSRAAELAREVRYVKQRFRQGDEARRPFLVRAMRLEMKDRDKPIRDIPLSRIEALLFSRVGASPEVERAIKGMGTMLRARWKHPDPELAGFQARALEAILPAWLGDSGDDAFVITAETGTGKTEAGVLPLIVGATVDALRGVRGTRAVLVYPRIRLAANQAQRMAAYLAGLSRVEGMPLLTLGMQNQDVPFKFGRQPDESKGWTLAGDGTYSFPFFPCPESGCGCELCLESRGGVNGADRLLCRRCGWDYAGWVGSKVSLFEHPPHFFLPITESLHHWLHHEDKGRLFGDDPQYAGPRAVLADEIHLYSHLHGAQVGYALRRLITRAELNRKEHEGRSARTLAIGMSATLGKPDEVWGSLCGREHVAILRPEQGERKLNPRGREYFYFVQPEVESRGHDIAGASTSIQALMCLAHGMRRRKGDDGGYRGIVFLDSIDKLKRLHSNYLDAEQGLRLARLRTRMYGDDPSSGTPRRECCRSPQACDSFRQGECWLFAATDRRQQTVEGSYRPGRSLAVCSRPVYSRTGGRADELIQRSDLVFSTSSLEVGFDDPDMILVYQHYAPLNLASFIQRKGRGGRGVDDRPITGVTLSPYSARDSWFFRRPAQMLDPSGFEVPLNVENYFVCRGQVLSLVLDVAARRKRRSLRNDAKSLLEEADGLVRSTFGQDIYERLEVASLEELWKAATRDMPRPEVGSGPSDWAEGITWVPRLLFQSINLPLLEVEFPNEKGEKQQETEDVALAFSGCAPGNMTRRFGTWAVHWIPPLPGRQPFVAAGTEAGSAFRPTGGNVTELARRLPKEARRLIGPKLHAEVWRPAVLKMELGGSFKANQWYPDWSYDADRRMLVKYDQAASLPGVGHKSQGRLRGFLLVDTEGGPAESRPLSGLGTLANQVDVFCGTAARGRRTGLKVSRVYWGSDARLILEQERKPQEEEYISQIFAHPEDSKLAREADRCALLHGYEIETEGVQLRLDRKTLDAFVEEELKRLKGFPTEEKWFRGQYLRFLLMSHGAASAGLNPYQVRQLADLMVTAAAFEGFRKELQALLHRWDSGRFAKLLMGVYSSHLRQHPMLSERKLERLRDEVITTRGFELVLKQAWEGVRSDDGFRGYLRSLLLHGLAIRLEQSFVRHGRGDERRVLFHVKLPVQFDTDAEDLITLAEDGSYGDGTTRTFVAHLEQAMAEMGLAKLADCPNAEEDRLLASLAGREAEVVVWRGWDPRDERSVQRIASALGVDLEAGSGPFQGVLRLLFGAEEVEGERFELYELHWEIRRLGTDLAQRMGRAPSAWELVGTVVGRAVEGDPAASHWTRLLERYRALEFAVHEESLGAEARLAEQVYRISARLCVDGCQACLHTGSSLMDGDMAEVTVSRRILERLAAFLQRG